MSSDEDPPESDPSSHITAVVLAAGRGRRLRSELPKPLFPICGRAMASHVLHAVAGAGIRQAVVVVPEGERGERIRDELARDAACLNLRFAVQREPKGTADAVLAAREEVQTSHVLVVNGDLPLITSSQIQSLSCVSDADAVLSTAIVDDPAKMGRIARDDDMNLLGIVEWREASPAQREIREVNLGCYLFRTEFLWPVLERNVADPRNSGEAYATDAVPVAVKMGSAVAVQMDTLDGRLNVETPADAADAETVMRGRIIDRLLDSGVLIRDRQATWIDAGVSIEAGVIIEPGSHLRGSTIIRAGSRIGPNAVLEDAHLGRHCLVESCTIRGSTLQDHVEVGPYSTIRPGCDIGPHVHIGTHAELKEARVGEHVQIGHFSYVGDADVGARSNIGAGAITCNFDGQAKQRTIIGEDAFIGSDTMLIAPIRIGNRARTGAAAVVTKDVPDDGNAVGHPARLTPARPARRSRQSEERGS